MRALYHGILLALLVVGPAAAQSALEGPLSLPDAALSPSKAPAKAGHKKIKKIAARTQTPAFQTSGAGASTPVQRILSQPSTDPADPLSLGMKWNGSNDSARDTRVQNYGGAAQGSGAEVGMKLHF